MQGVVEEVRTGCTGLFRAHALPLIRQGRSRIGCRWHVGHCQERHLQREYRGRGMEDTSKTEL